MRLTTLTMFVTMLLALSIPASADVGLHDWCVNLNGNIGVCNGGASPGGTGSVNVGGFDTTLEPNLNSLGSITVTIVGTGAQYASVWMDYDVDNPTFGAFGDLGNVGSISATQSWELADPNISNIFSDFSGSALTNTNTVDSATTCGNGGPPWCDVSWALAESLTIGAGFSGATVTFTVSTSAPTSGFYLQQTNQVTGNSIYLSDTVSLTPLTGPPPAVPEPASVVLMATMIAGALWLRKRSGATAV